MFEKEAHKFDIVCIQLDFVWLSSLTSELNEQRHTQGEKN